jgi:hypothetical protein
MSQMDDRKGSRLQGVRPVNGRNTQKPHSIGPEGRLARVRKGRTPSRVPGEDAQRTTTLPEPRRPPAARCSTTQTHTRNTAWDGGCLASQSQTGRGTYEGWVMMGCPPPAARRSTATHTHTRPSHCAGRDDTHSQRASAAPPLVTAPASTATENGTYVSMNTSTSAWH